MSLRTIAIAAAVACLPAAASAVEFGPMTNVMNGGTYDVSNAPFFFDSNFMDPDGAGMFTFTFTNNSLGVAAVSITAGTVLQNTLEFVGGVTFEWLEAGTSAFVPQGAPFGGGALTSTIQPGDFDVLKLTWGEPVETIDGGAGDIDFNIKVSAIPLPASLLMLFGALGGLAFIGRRR